MTASILIWDPQKQMSGPQEAKAHQDQHGGHVFLSDDAPGYAVWFSGAWTKSEIMLHPVTIGHSGMIS